MLLVLNLELSFVLLVIVLLVCDDYMTLYTHYIASLRFACL